jgi:hypothetical protein
MQSAKGQVSVRIVGWRPGLRKVSHTQALQEYGHLSLSQAKAATDAVLEGSQFAVSVSSLQAALALVARLEELGAIARVESGTSDGT